MDSLHFRSAYHADPASLAAFNDFLIAIHGLDLADWIDRIGYDEDFVHFSFFSGREVVASTSVYSIEMILRGESCRVAQISSVGTRPAWRRRGLNAELTRRALQWVGRTGHRGTFLFSDEDAVGFYAEQGFVPQSEWRHRIEVSSRPSDGARRARRLHFDADEPTIRGLVSQRAPVSKVLGARSEKLELFHYLYDNVGELRFVESAGALVACEQEDGVLRVYDVVAPTMPRWSSLEPSLVDARTRVVEFWFSPDALGVGPTEVVEDRSSCLHVLPGENLFEGPVMIPWTVHA